MSDIRLREAISLDGPDQDWILRDAGTLDEREELATAVRLALGTDRLADVNEILPDPDSTDRRGWWGDLDAEEIWDGWPIGCKNWLLRRAKIMDAPSSEGSTLQRAKQYTLQALQPLIDKRVATRIDAQATRTDIGRIEVYAIVYRGPNSEIALRYQLLWEEDPIVEDVTLRSSSVHTKIRVPYRSLLLASSAINPALLSDNRIYIPPRANLELSSIALSFGKTVPQSNAMISPTAPAVKQNSNRYPSQGSTAISPTAPTVVRGILFTQDMGTLGSTFGTAGVTTVTLNVGASSPWTVPSDCVSLATIDCYGPGYAGAVGFSGTQSYGSMRGGSGGNGGNGGGGGGWARKNNAAVTPGNTIAFSIGSSNSTASTVFGTVCTATGASGSTPGTGTVGDAGATGGSGVTGELGYINPGNTNGGFGGGYGGAGGVGAGPLGGGGGAGGAGAYGQGMNNMMGNDGYAGAYGSPYGGGGGGGGGGSGGSGPAVGFWGGYGGSNGGGANGGIVLAYYSATFSQGLVTTATAPTGSTVVVGVSLNTNNGVTAASVSDGTNTYTKIETTGVIGGASEVSLWYATLAAPLASGSTITVTFSGGTSGAGNTCNMSAAYLTGLAATPLDKHAFVSASSGNSVSVATGVLSQATEIVIGFGGDTSGSSGTSYNGASGFTNINKSNSSNGCTALDYDIVRATTTVTFNPVWGSALRMGAVVASFKG